MATMVERETPLADLVRRVHDQGVSYYDMARRAAQAGHTISHAQLQALAKGQVAKAPSIPQMQAIAAALDLGYEQVRAAMFQQFFGYVPRELTRRRGERIVAATPPDLTDDEERQLAEVVAFWIEQQRRK